MRSGNVPAALGALPPTTAQRALRFRRFAERYAHYTAGEPDDLRPLSDPPASGSRSCPAPTTSFLPIKPLSPPSPPRRAARCADVQRTKLAALALDAYPEAYAEFKQLGLALLFPVRRPAPTNAPLHAPSKCNITALPTP